MTEITKGVYFIAGQDEAIPDSHVYILGDPASRDLSIVDAGLVGKGESKLQSLNGLGVEREDIKRVIMTHTHLDHIGCLREIKALMPWVEVWIHRDEAEPLEQGDERTVYGMDMFRSLCESQYGLRPGDFRLQVDRKLEDGETLEIGGMSWEVVHVPGHSCGSIALYNPDGKILIPGDVVYADYAIGRFDLHRADGAALKDSLKRLAELEVEVLLPGHNRIVKGLPQGYISDTLRQWESYLN
ncbi:MAG: MBL fold metallo-hydrolase [Deltaproteobacteria bacterium]|nr:MBL fold metallo-hydrolase [Deltaproteobacteria bacterium]MBW2137885.1 MBL fold metallo-hydrolase [Deltaproteobacteria bacterium]